jgi:hypothetical protein
LSEAAEALRNAPTADGGKIEVLELDVTSEASVAAAAEQVRADGTVPDVIVNNAGQMYVGITEAFTTELFGQSPSPEDADGRAATYPSNAHQTFKEMGAAFEGMFEDPEVPTDPKLVVDRIVELIEMAPGTREFRGAVGFDVGVNARNASDEAHDPEFLEMMGLTEFVKLRTGEA